MSKKHEDEEKGREGHDALYTKARRRKKKGHQRKGDLSQIAWGGGLGKSNSCSLKMIPFARKEKHYQGISKGGEGREHLLHWERGVQESVYPRAISGNDLAQYYPSKVAGTYSKGGRRKRKETQREKLGEGARSRSHSE